VREWDQQQEGIHFSSSDLYALALKKPKARFAERLQQNEVVKAFLYGEVGC
jgi:hypothetical protein